MVELENAVKNICIENSPDDHQYIIELQQKRWEMDNYLTGLKLELQSKEKIKLQELKNRLNLSLIANGYETIDENIEVQQ